MDLSEAVSYVATCLAMRTLHLMRDANSPLASSDTVGRAEVAQRLTSKAAAKLGISDEYEEVLAHLLKCNPV